MFIIPQLGELGEQKPSLLFLLVCRDLLIDLFFRLGAKRDALSVEVENFLIQSIWAAIELFFAGRLAAVAAELRPFWYLLVTSLAFHMFSLLPFEKRRKNPLRFSDMT